MTQTSALRRSRALWNRRGLDLRSRELIAQILDRGELEAWRELFALAAKDPQLRQRMLEALRSAPVGLPHFWLAALASLGEPVDWTMPLPEDPGI